MVHTFYLWRCADITAQAAKALGKQSEADEYKKLAEKTKTAFQNKFYDKEKGSYGLYGGNIFALKMGVPADQYARVVAALKSDILANGRTPGYRNIRYAVLLRSAFRKRAS